MTTKLPLALVFTLTACGGTTSGPLFSARDDLGEAGSDGSSQEPDGSPTMSGDASVDVGRDVASAEDAGPQDGPSKPPACSPGSLGCQGDQPYLCSDAGTETFVGPACSPLHGTTCGYGGCAPLDGGGIVSCISNAACQAAYPWMGGAGDPIYCCESGRCEPSFGPCEGM